MVLMSESKVREWSLILRTVWFRRSRRCFSALNRDEMPSIEHSVAIYMMHFLYPAVSGHGKLSVAMLKKGLRFSVKYCDRGDVFE